MEYKSVLKVTLPKSVRGRLRRVPFVSAGMLTVFGLMIGLILGESSKGEWSILDWTTGILLWLFAILLIPLYLLAAGRISRAAAVYVGLALAMLPSGVALLDGSLRLSVNILGAGSTLLIGLGLLAGLGTMPFVIRDRRQWFQQALRGGHLRRSLDSATGKWDPQHDLDQIESSKLLNRPGCLLRLLPWVGPAIGMSLDNIFGEAAALRIFVYLFLLLGYAFTYLPVVGALVQLLVFRRLEKELGRPILLAEEPASETR